MSWLLFVGFVALWRHYADQTYPLLNRAEWIWAHHDMKADEPLVFFASTNFELPERRSFTKIRVAADPLYTLYFNGVEVGDGGWSLEPGLDEWNVSELAITGVNRIVVSVRSERGVGGLIASVAIHPMFEGIAATGPEWRIHGRWDPTILSADTAEATPPRVLGKPPWGPWDFPELHVRERRTGAHYVHNPLSSRLEETGRPVIQLVSGVPIAGIEKARATTFDFGQTVHGRLSLEMEGPTSDQLVRIRTGTSPEHLAEDVWPLEIAIAPGEKRITIPGDRGLRYLSVFRDDVTASVVSRSPHGS